MIQANITDSKNWKCQQSQQLFSWYYLVSQQKGEGGTLTLARRSGPLCVRAGERMEVSGTPLGDGCPDRQSERGSVLIATHQ